MSKAEGVTSLMPLKWELSEQSWRLSAMGRWSRGGVSTAQTVIARKLTASRAGEGKPTPTSDDACSESQDCQGNHKRCRAKVRKTLSSAQRTTTSTSLHISATRTSSTPIATFSFPECDVFSVLSDVAFFAVPHEQSLSSTALL